MKPRSSLRSIRIDFSPPSVKWVRNHNAGTPTSRDSGKEGTTQPGSRGCFFVRALAHFPRGCHLYLSTFKHQSLRHGHLNTVVNGHDFAIAANISNQADASGDGDRAKY